MKVFKGQFAKKRQVVGHHNKLWCWLSAAVAVMLVVVYIGLNNDVSTQGYRLKSLQQEASKLEEINTALEIQVAAEQSLQRLDSEKISLALTPVGQIEYLAAPDTAVAAR